MHQLGKGRLLARRNPPPTVTAELTPLIDVVFLLLTFFILAAVLMVRVDVLGIRLPTLAAGTPLERQISDSGRERCFVVGSEGFRSSAPQGQAHRQPPDRR